MSLKIYSSSEIISAMQKLARDKGFKFDLNESVIEEERKSRTTAKILGDYLKRESESRLDKKGLARQLVLDIIARIQSQPGAETSALEAEIRNIFAIIMLDNNPVK